MLVGQPESRLFAFFESYVEGENKRLRKWLQSVQTLSDPEKAEHVCAIEHRRTGVAAISDVLGKLRNDLASANVPLTAEVWPNVATRFEAIGDAQGYRTLYSRMSSQVHSDAEETIRYFIGRISNDEKLRERMAVETIWFSRFMLYFAVRYFLRATSAYSKCYGMDQEFMFLIDHGQLVISEELDIIARNVDDRIQA